MGSGSTLAAPFDETFVLQIGGQEIILLLLPDSLRSEEKTNSIVVLDGGQSRAPYSHSA